MFNRNPYIGLVKNPHNSRVGNFIPNKSPKQRREIFRVAHPGPPVCGLLPLLRVGLRLDKGPGGAAPGPRPLVIEQLFNRKIFRSKKWMDALETVSNDQKPW